MVLEEIVKLSWFNFFQVIQSYFITPYERILTQFDENSLFVPIELRKALSEDHVQKDLIPILAAELEAVKANRDDIKKPSYQLARAKLKYFLEQMSAILSFKDKIRPIVVPGREMSLVYIQRAMFYGPLASLINAGEMPPGAEVVSPIRSLGDQSMRFISQLVAISLTKYKRERLSYNDQEIKELIAIRNEKERVNVIAEFDKLTDEERAVELINKKLGIGKWAVGGTKLIYAYDKDYYDLERQKREAAGIAVRTIREWLAETGYDLQVVLVLQMLERMAVLEAVALLAIFKILAAMYGLAAAAVILVVALDTMEDKVMVKWAVGVVPFYQELIKQM
jgi:hypothetical protein